MLYLFYGDDDYTAHTQAAAAVAHYAHDSMFGMQRFDGATTPWGDIVAACHVLPFLSPHQVVRVSGLLAASARRRAASGDDFAKPGASPDAVTGLVKAMPDTTILVLEEGALPRRSHGSPFLDDDRRRALVELTEDGRQRLGAERRRSEGWLAQAIANEMTERERALLARAVELFRRLSET